MEQLNLICPTEYPHHKITTYIVERAAYLNPHSRLSPWSCEAIRTCGVVFDCDIEEVKCGDARK